MVRSFRLHAVTMREAAGHIVEKRAVTEQLFDKPWLEEMAPLIGHGQRATQVRKARHERHKRDAARLQHTAQLRCCLDPLGWIGQVVERSKAHDCVEIGVCKGRQVDGIQLQNPLHTIVQPRFIQMSSGDCLKLR